MRTKPLPFGVVLEDALVSSRGYGNAMACTRRSLTANPVLDAHCFTNASTSTEKDARKVSSNSLLLQGEAHRSTSSGAQPLHPFTNASRPGLLDRGFRAGGRGPEKTENFS